ncbi:MAG TPA: tetratricopeptide repeat protein [Anaerolineales bacterium]|nr:tetratricopeptide repeat protein [Anaerolineales bacterium]
MVAKISLRDYLGGIEELVDNGRTEDALAHCRHILTLFPKNVATYRLMGKAYLESHQHNEASDIFQRVLSSIPDDFVSHIGLSIIHEEAGDLDAAIWNMERAFEAQPSNRAVQDELRRLYGKREGYAAPKVRLTRGALARMYAHGDLYNQAIGELRGALTEDPQRPDLQVLLAEMYLKVNRESEAEEACNAILEKLPYCLYANRLMAAILRNSQREDEAKIYLDRVEEVDPYAARVDISTSADLAAANIAMLEKLVIETPAAKMQPVPRAWSGSLVFEEREFSKEELPKWLSVENEGMALPEETKTKDVTEEIESTISEEPPSIPPFDVGAQKENLAKDELEEKGEPDWLSELRPVTTSLVSDDEEEAVSGETGSEELSDRLDALRPDASELGSESQEHQIGSEPIAAPTEQLYEKEESPVDQEQGTDKVPFSAEESPEGSTVTEAKKSPEEDRSLSWLENRSVQQAAAEVELPSTEDLVEESKQVLPEETEKEKSPEEDMSLGWLENLAAQQGAPEEELLTPPEGRKKAGRDWPVEEKPEETQDVLGWLDELTAESEQDSAAGQETPAEQPIQEPSAVENEKDTNVTTPLWLKELTVESEQDSTADQETPAGQPIQEPSGVENEKDINVTTPLWLKELTSEMGGTAKLGDEAEESVAPRSMGEAPDWLSDLPPVDEAPTEEEVEEAVKVEAEPPETAEEISKLDWLEELGPPKTISEKGEWISENQPPGQQAITEAVAEPPVKPKKAALKARQEAPSRLEIARQSLNNGKLGEAADHYGYLLRRRWLIKDVIADLDAAVHRHPGDATLWQTLGDAYMRNNQLRQALDCYNRAKDLL